MLANVDWTFAGSVIVSGLVVVFSVLVLLWVIVVLLGRILTAFTGGGKGKKAEAAKIENKAPEAKTPAAAPMPIVEDGISDEVVAVIAAAIASMTGGRGVLRSVKRAGGKTSGRSPWMSAGLLQNTRPF